jgi:CheY-like chemotaxis protein
MVMRKMDGREGARRLRANPETKEIPILAITALFRSHDLTLVCWRAATATSSSRLVFGIFRQKFENC